VTATAPHDAFRLASALLIIDAQITARHELLKAAVERLDLDAVRRLTLLRDRALDERLALRTVL
jgi:nitric oxide synthase oxygenase domain/subunit